MSIPSRSGCAGPVRHRCTKKCWSKIERRVYARSLNSNPSRHGQACAVDTKQKKREKIKRKKTKKKKKKRKDRKEKIRQRTGALTRARPHKGPYENASGRKRRLEHLDSLLTPFLTFPSKRGPETKGR